MSDAVAGMLQWPCLKCGARPQQWCTTRSGYRSSTLHRVRWRAWQQATRHGGGGTPGPGAGGGPG